MTDRKYFTKEDFEKQVLQRIKEYVEKEKVLKPGKVIYSIQVHGILCTRIWMHQDLPLFSTSCNESGFYYIS